MRYGANDFIGEVVIDLAHHILDDEAEWYQLQPHQDNSHLVCLVQGNRKLLFRFTYPLVRFMFVLCFIPVHFASFRCVRSYLNVGVGKRETLLRFSKLPGTRFVERKT